MKKLTILFILFSTFLYSQNTFKISGKLKGFGKNAVVRITKNNLVIDSCKLNNENFILKGTLQNSPNQVFLQVKDGDNWMGSYLFIGNENITINANINDFPFDVKTKGSKFDDKRFELDQKIKPLQIQRNELLRRMFSLREQKKWNDSLQKDFWSKQEPLGKIVKIDNGIQKIEYDFISENINSHFALYRLDAIKAKFGNDKINQVLSKLKPEFRKSIYTQSILNHLKYPDLIIDDNFYNFQAIDFSGKKVQFSQYFNNKKYVLLDFSTIYCGWCLAAIPELEKLKNEKTNLEIVTFYVDKDKEGFDKLRKKHSNNWDLLWDQKGRLSETYAKYKVYVTPTFYLFNPEGKLVKKFDGLNIEEIKSLIN